MNDQQTAPAATPQAAPNHAAPAAAAVMAQAATPPVGEPQKPAPEPGKDPNNPPWLPDRLKAAKATALRETLESRGFKSAEELDAALADYQQLKQAGLTEAEKQKAELDALKPKAADAERLSKLTNDIVAAQFEALPETQRTAIDQVAEGNAEKRWQLMQMFRAAGGTVDATTIPQNTPGAKAPPQPATTTGGASPPPATPTGPSSKWDEYQAMKKSDPMGAAIFYSANAIQIERASPAETQE